MLLGENAAGKSSILQAIALNLMSDADRDRLMLPHRQFVRRGTSRAHIELRFRSDENRASSRSRLADTSRPIRRLAHR